MSGISQYYHGERGEVVEVSWIPDKDLLYYTITLRGNPFRIRALDYSSDIGIDPIIKIGDRPVYLRLDSYCGIWVATQNRFSTKLEKALERVKKNRQYMKDYQQLVESQDPLLQRWLDSLKEKTGVPVGCQIEGEQIKELSFFPVTIFLSYCHNNYLLAKEIRFFLSYDAKAEVWFAPEKEDLQQRLEAIKRWEGEEKKKTFLDRTLMESIQNSKIFILLLTSASMNSEYVQKELAWAEAKALSDKAFRLVLLKIENVPTPQLRQGGVVDCKGLGSEQFLEEIYAAAYNFEGHREWLEEQKRREGDT